MNRKASTASFRAGIVLDAEGARARPHHLFDDMVDLQRIAVPGVHIDHDREGAVAAHQAHHAQHLFRAEDARIRQPHRRAVAKAADPQEIEGTLRSKQGGQAIVDSDAGLTAGIEETLQIDLRRNVTRRLIVHDWFSLRRT